MATFDENKLKKLTDGEIVHALLKRDSTVTRWFFYKKCYPLFKAAFKKFKPSFEEHRILIDNELDLIHEIYSHVMFPSENGKCALDTFGFSSTLTNWLKVVTKNYCLQCIKLKPIIITLVKTNPDGDNFIPNEPSISIDGYNLAFSDIEKVIDMVHLPRNRKILYIHYIEKQTSEEAAAELEITKAAYDNALSRAKKEFHELIKIHLK